MERLPRYPLSVVLSFLTETEGTSLLITNRKYALKTLPQFRLNDDSFAGLMVLKNVKHRHRFVVVPVQDPTLLLARLNTRRIRKRNNIATRRLSTTVLAAREWKEQSLEYRPELELLRFADKQHELHKAVGTLLVSYPRSGNSLLRSLLERTTGIVTGADTRPDRALSLELAEMHNLVGEGVTLTTAVPFIKSHWPERKGTSTFESKRVILLVRNPFDAIDSYWNMNATKSHTESLTDEVYARFRDKYNALVENEMEIWLRFHEYWLEKSPVPVTVVRFEDLIRAPKQELVRVLQFALGQAELTDFWMKRVDHVTSAPVDKLGSYQPRAASKGAVSIGKSLMKGRYSDEMLQTLHRAADSRSVNYLQTFGYDIFQQRFPTNFKKGTEAPTCRPTSKVPSKPFIEVNTGSPVRPPDCPFGRALQAWRHSITNNDTDPLPTVKR